MKLVTQKTIEKAWDGYPGAIVCFPVRISLSSSATAEREATLALTAQQRTERLLDFRMRTVADILTEAPYMLLVEDLDKALEAVQETAIAALPEGLNEEERTTQTEHIRQTLRLTAEDIQGLREPFPGFPEWTPETLAKVAYDYFNQDDGKGGKPYSLLIEEVAEAYWFWATPRPTISVSAYMQGK